ncbi:F-box protein FBW2-like [Neltuma alba]|uniref:F-box protein FBW2-like n=1 Tax=Neltuma alba TaxID=207710 RepID=UPI0010A2DD5A|nr:F-box protein FBW2-like [Prosopis alba]XP_028794051.1 F-box protein FBW2-like [Prosopis alba]XP_028794052.1 F-box protein FBW2-like [Prosopis alba]
MEAGSESQRCYEQRPEALGLILSRVSLQDGVSEPHFCHEIDLMKWSNCPQQPDQLDRIVQMLVTRISGSIGTLCVSGLQSDSIFTLIAQNASCLRTLRIPKSSLSDFMMEQLAGRLPMISFLDVSYCMNLSARGLEVVGKNCTLLEGLCRNMYPWHTGDHDEPSRDNEAMAIASTMPKLKHLEIASHWMTTEGVHKILCACSKLEYFDMWGCENVEAGKLGLHKFPKLTVWGPRAYNCFDGGDNPSEEMDIE